MNDSRRKESFLICPCPFIQWGRDDVIAKPVSSACGVVVFGKLLPVDMKADRADGLRIAIEEVALGFVHCVCRGNVVV